MNGLTAREIELVSIGAAIGGNCVPCIEHHIPAAKREGLTNGRIFAAIQIADGVKKVPSQKVYQSALELVETADIPPPSGGGLYRGKRAASSPARRAGMPPALAGGAASRSFDKDKNTKPRGKSK